MPPNSLRGLFLPSVIRRVCCLCHLLHPVQECQAGLTRQAVISAVCVIHGCSVLIFLNTFNSCWGIGIFNGEEGWLHTIPRKSFFKRLHLKKRKRIKRTFSRLISYYPALSGPAGLVWEFNLFALHSACS